MTRRYVDFYLAQSWHSAARSAIRLNHRWFSTRHSWTDQAPYLQSLPRCGFDQKQPVVTGSVWLLILKYRKLIMWVQGPGLWTEIHPFLVGVEKVFMVKNYPIGLVSEVCDFRIWSETSKLERKQHSIYLTREEMLSPDPTPPKCMPLPASESTRPNELMDILYSLKI